MREYRQGLELRLLDELLVAQAEHQQQRTPESKSRYVTALRHFNDLVLYHRLPEHMTQSSDK